MFRLVFGAFALDNFEADFFRLISINRATIPATVEMPLDREIVRVAQAFSGNDKADMNDS